MQFNKKIGNRIVTMSKANKGDFNAYRRQIITYLVPSKEKINVLNDESHFYLKIQDMDLRLIGIVQIAEIDETTAEIKVSIPNEPWELRYGTEVIHQLVKNFTMKKTYSRIYLKKSKTVDRYKKERPEMFKNGNYCIEIA